MPGLIDAHVHTDPSNDLVLSQSFTFGVTTVLEMGNFSKNVSRR